MVNTVSFCTTSHNVEVVEGSETAVDVKVDTKVVVESVIDVSVVVVVDDVVFKTGRILAEEINPAKFANWFASLQKHASS